MTTRSAGFEPPSARKMENHCQPVLLLPHHHHQQQQQLAKLSWHRLEQPELQELKIHLAAGRKICLAVNSKTNAVNCHFITT